MHLEKLQIHENVYKYIKIHWAFGPWRVRPPSIILNPHLFFDNRAWHVGALGPPDGAEHFCEPKRRALSIFGRPRATSKNLWFFESFKIVPEGWINPPGSAQERIWSPKVSAAPFGCRACQIRGIVSSISSIYLPLIPSARPKIGPGALPLIPLTIALRFLADLFQHQISASFLLPYIFS